MQNVSKAKARGKQVSNNLSISDAQTSENFCKGEDDAGKINTTGTMQHS